MTGASASHARVALVTGSGRPRVGREIARHLARAGYRIAVHYHRSRENAAETVRLIREDGAEAHAFHANVASETDVDAMIAAIAERFGRLDVLVTTASIWDRIPLEQITADDLVKNFSVNTMGTFLPARRAGLLMAEQPEGGAIVAIGDWAVARPYLGHAAYFISKGAIETLTRVLAVELAHRNPRVTVNAIHPGPVMFPPDASDAERREMTESTLVKQANSPEAVCRAVEFLIHSPFVTGTCLTVDGGRTIYASEPHERQI